jgi:hypothetical protein
VIAQLFIYKNNRVETNMEVLQDDYVIGGRHFIPFFIFLILILIPKFIFNSSPTRLENKFNL